MVGMARAERFAHEPPCGENVTLAAAQAEIMIVESHPLRNEGWSTRQMGYEISPDPMPEEVNFIRSDQYSFCKAYRRAISSMESRPLIPR